MTQTPSVLLKKKEAEKKPFYIDAIVTTTVDNLCSRNMVEGWSTHNEPHKGDRGLNIAINDDTEVLIPFDQIRKFVKYMDKKGL